jgi:hypothetical protein
MERLAIETDVRLGAGRTARRRILEVFRLSGMLEGYRNLYLELAERRGLSSRK